MLEKNGDNREEGVIDVTIEERVVWPIVAREDEEMSTSGLVGKVTHDSQKLTSNRLYCKAGWTTTREGSFCIHIMIEEANFNVWLTVTC